MDEQPPWTSGRHGRAAAMDELLGALLWGKWGLFKPQGIQALKSSAVWCNSVARGVSWDYDVIVLQEGES